MDTRQKKLLYWWVSVLAIGTVGFWLAYFGVAQKVWVNDFTYITSLCTLLYLTATGMLAYVVYAPAKYIANDWAGKFGVDLPMTASYFSHERITDHCWFFSELLMGLGLVGTGLGLIHMLEAAASLNIGGDPATNQKVFTEMTHGLAVAFFTNVTGVITSMALKFQTQFMGHISNEE